MAHDSAWPERSSTLIKINIRLTDGGTQRAGAERYERTGTSGSGPGRTGLTGMICRAGATGAAQSGGAEADGVTTTLRPVRAAAAVSAAPVAARG
jgi:hypothetical protein